MPPSGNASVVINSGGRLNPPRPPPARPPPPCGAGACCAGACAARSAPTITAVITASTAINNFNRIEIPPAQLFRSPFVSLSQHQDLIDRHRRIPHPFRRRPGFAIGADGAHLRHIQRLLVGS